VALAAYAGAGIAKGEPMRTGINATKLAIGAFLIPYIFVMSPQLLLVNTTFLEAVRVALGAIIGMVSIESAVQGWLLVATNVLERILLAAAGLMLINPDLLTDAIGLGLFLALYLGQRWRARKQGITYLL
jgi:TRAP-type uncharacterized transport system fused permease subunit